MHLIKVLAFSNCQKSFLNDINSIFAQIIEYYE